MTTLERVTRIVAQLSNVDGEILKADSRFDALDIDSLDRLEIAQACEEEFQVYLEDDDLMQCETMADLARLIDRLRKATA